MNIYSIFKPGLVTNKRRESDEHTLRGLGGVYQCRINIIVVSSNHHHHTKTIALPRRNNSFADIPHVQGDFVHNLYQSGALKFVHQLHLSGDAADCGKRVIFGISFENYFGIYQNAPCVVL
jgi:hypothetical protein